MKRARMLKIVVIAAVLAVALFGVVRAAVRHGAPAISPVSQPASSSVPPAGAFAEGGANQVPASPADAFAFPSGVPLTASPESAIILTYHTVEPATGRKESKMQVHYHVLPEHFDRQLAYLRDNGYCVIAFPALVRAIKDGTNVPEKSVVLTFDDGWKNQYLYALPVLQKYGDVATFFVYPGAISERGSFMSWKDVTGLVDAGMDVESHSYTHPMLTSVTDAAKLAHELVDSRRVLEEKTGRPVTLFAYPYYKYDQRIEDALAAAGYDAARAGWTGTKNARNSLFSLASQEVVDGTNPFSAGKR